MSIQAAGFDRDAGNSVASGATGVLSSAMLENALGGGTVTIQATDSGLSLDGKVEYESNNQLLLIAEHDLKLDHAITNNGAGDIILAAGDNFHNNTGGTTPIATNGQWLVYSTRPDLNNNDIEIRTDDNIAFGVSFDVSDPLLSSYEDNGNWLLYSASPTVSVTVGDQTISYGETYDKANWALAITVDGTELTDTSEYLTLLGGTSGLSVTDRLTTTDYSAGGHINAGDHAGALTAGLTTYHGLTTSVQDGTLTVNPATLTITANDDSRTYDGSAYSGNNGLSYAGFVDGENETNALNLSGLIHDGNAEGAVDAGTYRISVDGVTANNDNYAIVYVDGTLTVNPTGPSGVPTEPSGVPTEPGGRPTNRDRVLGDRNRVLKDVPVKDRNRVLTGRERILLKCEPVSGAHRACPVGNTRWISDDRAGVVQ